MKTAIAAVAAVVAGAVAVWFGIDNAGKAQTIARLKAEFARARSVSAGPPSSSAPASAVASPQAQPSASGQGHQHFESTANPEADLLRARLAESKRTIDELNGRVQKLQEGASQVAEERTRTTAESAQMQTKVDELSRTVQALSSERADLGKRVADLESANAQLRNARSDSDRKNVQLGRLISDLEDVGRRQQTYLTNILRRYRDVTEQFRVLPAALDRNGTSSSGPEISRIQSALAMADEDLRQLNDLNARLVRVQKQLVAAASSK